MSALRLLSRTKLYWGLIAIFLIGLLFSPVTSSGKNIFLSYGNLLDVLRQVSITGLIATGMTAVIITGGIDLSVGSLMAICSVVCAMLLTVPGDTPAVAMGLPMAGLVALLIGVAIVRFVFANVEKSRSGGGAGRDISLDTMRGLILPLAFGAVLAGLLLWFLLPQVDAKFGVLGVLIVAPCVGLCFGAINGILIVAGRMQPFIVTLAMMVTALGIARLTAGQNNAVLPVYTGSNAVAEFDLLRSLVFGIVPMPGLFFIAAIVIYSAVLRAHALWPVCLCDWRQRGSRATLGNRVGKGQDRNLRRLGPARGHRGGPLRCTVPAGQAGRRCRPRTRCHRSRCHWRNQPYGRPRQHGRHILRGAYFRPALQHLATSQHQFESPARA